MTPIQSCFRRGLLSNSITLVCATFAAAHARAQLFPAGDPLPFELCTIDIDDGTLRKLSAISGFTCGSPDWSPDGKQIAFDTWRIQPYTATLSYNPQAPKD